MRMGAGTSGRWLVAALGVAAALVAAGWTLRSPRPAATPARAPETGWARRIRGETLAARPNIVLVVYDARRRDDFSLGPFGNTRGDTPFLSAFARDALVFEQAVSPGCWTVPVHASIFSGLSVCELGIDYYNTGFQSFSTAFLSLAEILGIAGYRTVAYADHPFFSNQDPRVSLLRGFQQFSVFTDLARYADYTNLGTPEAPPRTRYPFEGLGEMPWSELESTVRRFNDGGHSLDPGGAASRDPTSGLYFADLEPLFAESDYFRRRYLESFERDVFQRKDRPFFLFLNLHVCASALPDPALYSRWLLKTLLANAAARGRKLQLGPEADGVAATLLANARQLDARAEGFPSSEAFLRHVFDNRFYDATFRAVWQYLSGQGLDRNSAVFVTSDHGLSQRENGEQLYAHNGARPYEYMVGVPLLARFPAGHTADLAGRRSERISLTDLFATIVELGVGPGVFERSLPVRGRSLLERVEHDRFEPLVVSESSLLPLPYTVQPRLIGYSRALYHDRFKLILVDQPLLVGDGGWPLDHRLEDRPFRWPFVRPGFEEPRHAFKLLFDLVEDPHERRDVSAARPDVVARLEQMVPAGCESSVGARQRARWEGEALETLKTLGYVQ
jgi:arylsulfatase A-like enzyme